MQWPNTLESGVLRLAVFARFISANRALCLAACKYRSAVSKESYDNFRR